jgi:hypothetical protein
VTLWQHLRVWWAELWEARASRMRTSFSAVEEYRDETQFEDAIYLPPAQITVAPRKAGFLDRLRLRRRRRQRCAHRSTPPPGVPSLGSGFCTYQRCICWYAHENETACQFWKSRA